MRTEPTIFLGHFAVALGAKKAAPKVSLGTLVLAAQFADFLWPLLLLLGLEQVRIVPGITRVTPLDFVSYPYSHSLLAQAIWGLGIGVAYWAIRRDSGGAIVLGLLVPSHWLLDYMVHRPDMPLFLGSARYGLGLWNSVPITLALEFGVLAIGTRLYLTTTREKHGTGRYAFWSLLGFLTVLYIGSVFGPPPPSAHILAISALALWLTVPWAAWADRDSPAFGEAMRRSSKA